MTQAQATTKPARTTRAPVKTVNKSAAEIKANAQVEAERKKASKAALKKTLKGESAGVIHAVLESQARAEKAAKKAAPRVKTQAELDADQAAYLKALAEDAKAIIGEDATADQIAAYVKAQLAPATRVPGQGYQGPMLALRDAAKHYVTGKNGNPHCNDMVAELLSQLSREQTVDVLGHLLFDAKVTTAVNPYITLNPGQQSMNLRNKLRGAMKNNTVTFAALEAAVTAKLAAKA